MALASGIGARFRRQPAFLNEMGSEFGEDQPRALRRHHQADTVRQIWRRPRPPVVPHPRIGCDPRQRVDAARVNARFCSMRCVSIHEGLFAGLYGGLGAN